MSNPFGTPRRALRKARLDNLALVPGDLLPLKEQWQRLANDLPEGSVLICMPPPERPATGAGARGLEPES